MIGIVAKGKNNVRTWWLSHIRSCGDLLEMMLQLIS